jgi:hypothetical protein
MEEDRSVFKILKGKPTGKRFLETPSRVWKNNIRMNVKEIDVDSRNRTDSAKDGNC